MHPVAAKALFKAHTCNLSPALARRRGWVLHSLEFPVIDCAFTAPGRTTLRLRLHCNDWNDCPPSISLHATDGAPLETLHNDPTGVFNRNPHPTTQRPFICMRGSLEYHTHSGHIADKWDPLKSRSSYTLGGIMTQLWNAWIKGSD